MSRTLRSICICALCAVAPEWLTVAQAQALSPEGGEYALPSQLPGDQVLPSLELSSDGGWAVWVDNSLSALGPGVAAARLSSSLQAEAQIHEVTAPETPRKRGGRRRNSTPQTVPNITDPDVARLPHGGAAVTWQSGPAGASDAFIRFLGPDGEPAGDEVSLTPGAVQTRERERIERMSWRRNQLRNTRWRVTTEAAYVRDRTMEAHPAALPDGGVVVVYSGVRRAQTNSYEFVMEVSARTRRGVNRFTTNDVLRPVSVAREWKQDVFLRRFDAAFAPVGEEVLVNQFAENNQRSPEIAVLPDGRFVVVWISENAIPASPAQTAEVCVHGRLFAASGDPLGDEFQINSMAALCASPVVAASGEGGFTVAWNQRGPVRNNGWDINARSYDSQGHPQGDAFLVNERTYGDQFDPAIAMSGMNHLIVWTSLGQDGSREGVYARLVSAGSVAGSERRVNTTTEGKQMHPVVASNGGERFAVVWTQFAGASSFDLVGQIYRATPPPPAPPAPQVVAVSESGLQVSWTHISATENYELYLEGSSNPLVVTGTSQEVHGLEPESEYAFRLAYRLANGSRSLLSEPVTGMTLAVPGSIDEPSTQTGGAEETATIPPLAGPEENGALSLTSKVVDGRVVLTWNTIPGKEYQVQVSYDFNQWFDLGEPRQAAGDTDSIEMNPKERAAFFRVREMP